LKANILIPPQQQISVTVSASTFYSVIHGLVKSKEVHSAFTELEMHTSQMWERIQGDFIDSVVSIFIHLFYVPVIDSLYFVALITCFVYYTFTKTKTEMHLEWDI